MLKAVCKATYETAGKKTYKKVCKKCILDSSIPGIVINEKTGLCHFCETYNPLSQQEKARELAWIQKSLEERLEARKENCKYDVIFALSGGKDSSYTLYKLKKEYPFLRVLAVQFDNGFTSDSAIENARKLCETTDSDYFKLTLEKEILYEAFRKAAESRDAFSKFAKYRASDICNTCIGILKQKLIEQAIVQNVSFIVFAFTAAQVPKSQIHLPPTFIQFSRNLFEKQLQKMGIEDRDELFLIKNSIIKNMGKGGLYMLHPLCLWDYNEEEILKVLGEIGWNPPSINDSNSTNCTLNSFACYNHLKKYGFHPYAFDIAGLVRIGDMSRDAGLEKLHHELSLPLIKEAADKLRL